MTVHIVLLVAIMLFGGVTYIYNKPSINVNKWFIFLSLGMVFIVQALRAESVGSDTYVYVRSFYLIDKVGFNWRASAWEPCYLWLNMIVGFFTDNPQYLIAASSAIILGGIGLFIYKNMDHSKAAFWPVCAIILGGIGLFIYKNMDHSKAAFWPVFFFMVFLHYLNSMNLLRQYLAMAFVLQIYWILNEVEGKKKYIISILLLVIGVNFHVTAIVSVVYFIPYILRGIRRRSLFLIIVGLMVVTVVFNRILQLIYIIMPQYLKYSSTFHVEGEGFGGYYIVYALLIISLILYVFTLSPTKTINKKIYRLAFIVIVSLGLLFLKARIELAQRTGYYFDIFVILFIPEIINRLGRMKTLLYSLLLLYGVLCFMHTVDSEARGCVPYLFCWQ